MNRSQLAHILRAACSIAQDDHILVIGSQSILGSFSEDQLPADVTMSIEADIAFFDDDDERKADMVDGSIGELSSFHETFGVYGQGVSPSTAVLPAGWEERLVAFADPEAGSSHARCLDPHDLVVAKLVAAREKDHAFVRALFGAQLISASLVRERAQLLRVPIQRRRVVAWMDRWERSQRSSEH